MSRRSCLQNIRPLRSDKYIIADGANSGQLCDLCLRWLQHFYCERRATSPAVAHLGLVRRNLPWTRLRSSGSHAQAQLLYILQSSSSAWCGFVVQPRAGFALGGLFGTVFCSQPTWHSFSLQALSPISFWSDFLAQRSSGFYFLFRAH